MGPAIALSTNPFASPLTKPREGDAVVRRNKVPEVVLGFWIIKIAATTLGETGGDTLSMTLDLGFAMSMVIAAVCFAAVVALQIKALAFEPFLYWTVIVATTTLGTTMADFTDRSLGIGYFGGSFLLLVFVLGALGAWYRSIGTVSISRITTPRVEIFYWLAVLASNTFGTALGDVLTDRLGFGYLGGAMVFTSALAFIAVLYVVTDVSRVLLFWVAFILTRPLGATLGDFLTKPHESGGLALERFESSLVILAFMVACAVAFPLRAADHPGAKT